MRKIIYLSGDIKFNKLGPIVSKSCSFFKNKEHWDDYVFLLDNLNMNVNISELYSFCRDKLIECRDNKVPINDIFYSEGVENLDVEYIRSLKAVVNLLYRKQLIEDSLGIEIDSHYNLEEIKLVNSKDSRDLYKIDLSNIMDLVFLKLINEICDKVNYLDMNKELSKALSDFSNNLFNDYRKADILDLLDKDILINNYIKFLYNSFRHKSVANNSLSLCKEYLIENIVEAFNTIKKTILIKLNENDDVSSVSMGRTSILVRASSEFELDLIFKEYSRVLKLEMI